MKISILTDNKNSWFIPFGHKLINALVDNGHEAVYVNSKKDIPDGEVCFLLSCSNIIQKVFLKRNRHNIVVHASDLPNGKGFSPLQWQVLQGKNDIILTLFEAVENVDAGPFYIKKTIHFRGDELYDELRYSLGINIIEMCINYINSYESMVGIQQNGEESFYSKRSFEDDKIDVNKTIAEQFNHLRISDNENHPVWFNFNNCNYFIKIYKEIKQNESVNNSYRFYDFTLKNYSRLLAIAKEIYSFSFFLENREYTEKTILLRHDIEFSVPIALQMAKIENSLGIKATYFIQLHGDFYNGLEAQTHKQIKEIKSLGHQIALHFDAHFWDVSKEEELEKYLQIDKDTFEKYFGIEPQVFSFHNNNTFTMSCIKATYAGMINVYENKYKNEFGYCADSTGYWRYEVLENRLKEAEDRVLQVLIHDGMWQNEVLPPRRRVYKVIDDHAAYMKTSYDETLIKFGAKNIDWEGEV